VARQAKLDWDPFGEAGERRTVEERPIPDGLDAKGFWKRCKQDFRYYAEHCLRIRVKDYVSGKNEMVPFILRSEQELVLKEIERQEREKRPVRIIILKSRKIGFSTLIEAYGHWKCQFNRLFVAKCMAHRKESTEDIFEITQRFQTYQHPALETIAPGKGKRSSRDMGVFWEHGSSFEVETQGATDADRGSTPDYLHLSELGLWWKRRRTTSDAQVLQSSLGSIEDENGTYVFIESTACGSAGAFYTRFWAAWKNTDENLFKAFFFGWQDHHKYKLKEKKGERARHNALIRAYKGENATKFWEIAKRLGYDETWAKRAMVFDLSPWQVRWARRSLQTKFDGDLKAFDTEFPLSPEIAFTSSSESPLDQDAIRKLLAALDELSADCEQYESLVWDDERKRGAWEAGVPCWTVWYEPQKGHEYIVTADSSHGQEDGDFSCIQVGDRTERSQVAEFYYRAPPDVVAQQAYAAANYYNSALLAPEVDGPGLATLQNLLEKNDGAGYHNLYVRSRSGNWSQRFGFKMGTKAKRDACVAALAKVIRHMTWDLNSAVLLHECQTFITTAQGKCEAMPGEHDDAVVSMAQLLFIDSEIGESVIVEHREEPAPAHPNPRIAHWLSGGRDELVDPYLGNQW